MKKCPRCQRDITDHDKFCPHCGLDLSASLPKTKKKDGPKSNLIHIAFLVFILAFPFLYTNLLSDEGTVTNPLVGNKENALGEYTNKEAIVVTGQFDNLADFNAKYSNVSEYVNGIVEYENQLSSDHHVYDKEYVILVLDNNEIVFRLKYSARIDECHEVTIVREFNRMHTYNKQEIIYKKSNQTTFNDLLFSEEEIAFVNQYTDKDTYLTPVLNEFSSRSEEFDVKKESLGHFGLGTYHDNASFVIKKYGDVYTSVYTQYEVVDDYIC